MPGEYRINGVIRTLAATMNVTGLGLVADIVLLDPAPVNANTYRYDIIAANTSGLVDYVKGTASANPVFPALSSTQMMLAFVLVPNGMVTVHQSNVGQYFSTPVISNITFTIENNPFPWDPTEPYDNTTNVTVNFVDQYGDLIYMSGTTTSLEILAGTGTFDSLVKEASGVNHVTFVYTRLHDIGESSPYVMVTVTMTEGSRYLKNFFRIALLDVNGNELP
jgi:hypothetical protein